MHDIFNASAPAVGQRIRIQLKERIVWATVKAVRGDQIDFLVDADVRNVVVDGHISLKPERTGPCPCGGSYGVCSYHPA